LFSLLRKNRCVPFVFVFFPDGKKLVAWGDDDAVHMYDQSTGKDLYAFWPAEHERPRLLALSPDARTLVTWAQVANQVRLWEVATAKERRLLKGHEGEVYSAAFRPDSKALLTGSDDTSILVWDLTSPGNRP